MKKKWEKPDFTIIFSDEIDEVLGFFNLGDKKNLFFVSSCGCSC